MATTTNKNRCTICNKEKATLRCGGCSKDFCFSHVTDHHQELCKQLDDVEAARDLFRQTLIEQNSRPQLDPLMQQIDTWENDSINTIRQAANEARQLLFQYTTGHIAEIEIQLNKLTDQLRHSRQEDDFFETDLFRWNTELARLTEALNKPLKITIRQDSTSLVTKIIVDVQNFHNDDEDNKNDSIQRRSGPITRSLASLPRIRSTFYDSDDDSSYSSRAHRDIAEYRNNYPSVRQNPRINHNYEFYTNKRNFRPNGDFIDNIHKKWFGHYRRLEVHDGYIEWLFPLQEQGPNLSAEPLQKHEIEKIKKDETALERILKSYELMLDYYGFELVNERTGEIHRLPNDSYKARFRNFNASPDNYLRITRILKCLGEFDYEYLKFPFLEKILYESIIENMLPNCLQSCKDYWIETLRSQNERRTIRTYARELIEYRNKGLWPPKAHRAIRPSSQSSIREKIQNMSLSSDKKDNDNDDGLDS